MPPPMALVADLGRALHFLAGRAPPPYTPAPLREIPDGATMRAVLTSSYGVRRDIATKVETLVAYDQYDDDRSDLTSRHITTLGRQLVHVGAGPFSSGHEEPNASKLIRAGFAGGCLR